jgi:hypothetical protein
MIRFAKRLWRESSPVDRLVFIGVVVGQFLALVYLMTQ